MEAPEEGCGHLPTAAQSHALGSLRLGWVTGHLKGPVHRAGTTSLKCGCGRGPGLEGRQCWGVGCSEPWGVWQGLDPHGCRDHFPAIARPRGPALGPWGPPPGWGGGCAMRPALCLPPVELEEACPPVHTGSRACHLQKRQPAWQYGKWFGRIHQSRRSASGRGTVTPPGRGRGAQRHSWVGSCGGCLHTEAQT